MKKIPTALVRDPNNRSKVLPEITPGCEWVFAGEGVPTRKWDGTCVMLDENGFWWARREVKNARSIQETDLPLRFIEVDYDETTGKAQGWIPISTSPFAKFHEEALWNTNAAFAPGTYELVGPKINKNPESYSEHHLVQHRSSVILQDLLDVTDVEEIMDTIREVGKYMGWEGVVWHHPDGRMAKLKARDL